MLRAKPFLSVTDAARRVGKSRWAFLRWANDAVKVRDEAGALRWPDLLHRAGKRILIQSATLAAATGNPAILFEAEVESLNERMGLAEHRIGRLDTKVAELWEKVG